jgi:hypothetical protein
MEQRTFTDTKTQLDAVEELLVAGERPTPCLGSTKVYQILEESTHNPSGERIRTIRKIQHFPDGEIFYVGQKANWADAEVEILSLEEDKRWTGGLRIDYKLAYNGIAATSVTNLALKRSRPPSSVILTTEDGVDIRKGDQVWYIHKRYTSPPLSQVAIGNKVSPDYYFFSSKEKAEEYILMNKPINLTLSELEKAWEDNTHFWDTWAVINGIKKLMNGKH